MSTPDVVTQLDRSLRELTYAHHPTEYFEVRALRVSKNGGSPRPWAGWFTPSQIERAAQQVAEIDGLASGIYAVVNPIAPSARVELRHLADHFGRLKELPPKAKEEPRPWSTTDAMIARRAWLLIDCDPVRPADQNATDDEKALARELLGRVMDNSPCPPALECDSGNGWHGLWRIADAAASDSVHRLLKACDWRYSTDRVTVDVKVGNASRIVKLYGTLAKKGADLPARPHRRSRIAELVHFTGWTRTLLGDELVAWADALGYRPEPIPAPEVRPTVPFRRPDPDGNRPPAMERAALWLERADPAVSGSNGHGTTFRVVCSVGPGFDLAQEECFRLLWSDYNPRCSPPWSERELRHKVEQAYRVEQRRGWLLEAGDAYVPPPAAKPDPLRQWVAALRIAPATIAMLTALAVEEPPAPEPTAGPAPPPAPVAAVVLEGEVAYALPETELGNAQKFVARYGKRLRWVGAWGCWLIWDGRRWERDDCLQAQTLAKLLAISLPELTSAKWGAISQRKRTIDATLSLAKDALAIRAEALDKDPFLLNCLNGTINLLTGELRPHDQADLITKLVPATFDPEAPAPRWDQFEREVFADDQELIDYVRKVIAYGLCGDVRHQYLHLFYGDGENGKNKYLDTVRALLGDYACVAPDEILMETKGNEHPTGLAKLAGRRLVTCSETGDGKRLAESLVKRLTGEKTLTARYMRGDFFDFEVTFKLFLATNYQPQIKGVDRGIWRRIRLVPWKVTFSDEAQPDQAPLVLPKDEGLGPKLEAEMAGILARLVKACVHVLNTPNPLVPPSAVQAATEAYRKESNQVGSWLEERCRVYRDEPMRTQVRTKTSELFRDFCDWCEAKRVRPMNDAAFGRALTQLQIMDQRTERARFRLGVALVEPDSSADGDGGALPYTDGPAF